MKSQDRLENHLLKQCLKNAREEDGVLIMLITMVHDPILITDNKKIHQLVIRGQQQECKRNNLKKKK
jgi:hypothetical protein